MAYDDPFYSDLAKVEKRKVLKGIYQLEDYLAQYIYYSSKLLAPVVYFFDTVF